MNNKRIYLASPTMHGEELKYVEKAFSTNWIGPCGENVDEFPKEMARYVGCKAAAPLGTGTSAIHLAVRLSGIKRGDIVFCSDMTFSATVNPVSYEGGRQVFIDAERDSWNMDPVALEKAFEKYPQCKAVLVVHLYGTPCKLDEILDICRRHDAVLIEDAAESLSATYKGKMTGTFGKFGAISFNGNKIITSSAGGMLLSDDEEAIAKARFLATQARDPAPHYQHSTVGFNYRLNNVDAGIGRGQLPHIEEHRLLKKKIYEYYKNSFKDLPLTMNPYLAESEPNFWLSCILLDKGCKVKPMDIYNRMNEENIETRPIWKPMHLQPLYEGYDFITADGEDVGADIFSRGLCMPSDIKMTEEEQARVCAVLRSMF